MHSPFRKAYQAAADLLVFIHAGQSRTFLVNQVDPISYI